MAISVHCSCDQHLLFADELAGKRETCPRCGAVIEIPAINGVRPPGTPLPVPPPTASTVTPRSTSAARAPSIDRLFDEEKIGVTSEPLLGPTKPCPQCRRLASLPAVVCLECGWNFAAARPLERPRAAKKHSTDNPYGFDPYFEHDGPHARRTAGSERDSSGPCGPAWEDDENVLTKYFQTVFDVLTTPHLTFYEMRRYGGLGAPITFVQSGYVYAYLIFLLLAFVWLAVADELPYGLSQYLAAGENTAIGASVVFAAFVGGVLLLIGGTALIPLPLFFSAGILHLCLRAVGGAKEAFEVTFRAQGYATGGVLLPATLLSMVPFVGWLLGYAMQVVYTAIAVKYTQDIEWWQAIVAMVLSTIVCGFVTLGAVVVVFMALG